MTLEDLLNHFDFIPNKIIFYDRRDNFQDTVYTARSWDERLDCYTRRSYDNFKEVYEERKVADWNLSTDGNLDRSLILEVDFK